MRRRKLSPGAEGGCARRRPRPLAKVVLSVRQRIAIEEVKQAVLLDGQLDELVVGRLGPENPLARFSEAVVDQPVDSDRDSDQLSAEAVVPASWNCDRLKVRDVMPVLHLPILDHDAVVRLAAGNQLVRSPVG